MKPFAWRRFGGTDEKYEIVGIDQDRRLRSVILTKNADGYQVLRAGAHAERQDELIENSGSLRLADFQKDDEFPFKSEMLTVATCRVHFIFSWRALNRSLRTASLLTGIDVRIIVERDSTIISNEAIGLFFFGFREPLKRDINRDGKIEFVLIGQDNSAHIYIWAIEPECAVKPVLFEFVEGGETIRETSVSGRALFLKLDKESGIESVHTLWSEPLTRDGRFYWRTTEHIFKWDSRALVYRKASESTWLQKGD